MHLYLSFKSPSLSAIYFTKGNHCFFNHRLTTAGFERSLFGLETPRAAGGGSSLGRLPFVFPLASPWLPRELPCAPGRVQVPLKRRCFLHPWEECSNMSIRVHGLVSCQLTLFIFERGLLESLTVIMDLFLLSTLSALFPVFQTSGARCINI